MIFIEIDVDLSYALYFAALVFLIGQETQLVNGRLSSLEKGDVWVVEYDDEADDTRETQSV